MKSKITTKVNHFFLFFLLFWTNSHFFFFNFVIQFLYVYMHAFECGCMYLNWSLQNVSYAFTHFILLKIVYSNQFFQLISYEISPFVSFWIKRKMKEKNWTFQPIVKEKSTENGNGRYTRFCSSCSFFSNKKKYSKFI